MLEQFYKSWGQTKFLEMTSGKEVEPLKHEAESRTQSLMETFKDLFQ